VCRKGFFLSGIFFVLEESMKPLSMEGFGFAGTWRGGGGRMGGRREAEEGRWVVFGESIAYTVIVNTRG